MAINHIMCTSKVLTDSCFTKQRIKTKNTCKSCSHCFNSKNVLAERKGLFEH